MFLVIFTKELFYIKMNTQMIQDIKNRGIPPQFLSTQTHNWQKPDENQDPLKVDIKTHTGEVNRKTVSL